MSYTQNPHMPKVRRDAAAMVKKGYSPTEVGRRFGVGSSTISKWVKKAKVYGHHPIPTLSSRPKHHPHALKKVMVDAIASKRLLLKRSSEVVHYALEEEGVGGLSSVKRTLNRRVQPLELCLVQYPSQLPSITHLRETSSGGSTLLV